MSRLAFIFRTDVHASDRNPPSWKADYATEIFSSLEYIGQLAKKYEVTAVLDGGDYFHVKSPSRNSHSLIRQTAEIHGKYLCPVYSIIGNHDVVYNSLESIDRQPLGVLYAANVFHPLIEEVFKDGDLQVRVVGIPYSLNRTLADLLLRKKPGDDFLVAVVHALASPIVGINKVEEFFGEPVFHYTDLVYPSYDGPDMYLWGHWHQDQGIVCQQNVYFVNQGAVSRGSLTRDNVKRIPKVSLVEFKKDGIHAEMLPLNVAPAEDVFDLEKKERVEHESRSIDHFVEKLQSDAVFDTANSIEQNIQKLDFAVEVRTLALHYLELARAT